MSNYSYLDVSLNISSLCDLSCIENEIDDIDQNLINTHKNNSTDVQLSTVDESFNIK